MIKSMERTIETTDQRELWNRQGHIVEAQQFTPEFIEAIFEKAQHYKQILENGEFPERTYEHYSFFNMFYEESTRTRMSFDRAASLLGMTVAGTEAGAMFSSAAKGESLEDTITYLNTLHPHVIALRHPEDDSAIRAAHVSKVPIINAGSGKEQHPTQALLDLFTIADELGQTEGLNVVIGGDLAHGRTARSLAYLLSMYPGNSLYFVAPDSLQIGEDILAHLRSKSTSFSLGSSVDEVIGQADVVYWTRTQLERHDQDDLEIKGPDSIKQIVISPREVSAMQDHAILMHPLPRDSKNYEITPDVDKFKQAKYFTQGGNGLPVRMALLDRAISKSTQAG